MLIGCDFGFELFQLPLDLFPGPFRLFKDDLLLVDPLEEEVPRLVKARHVFLQVCRAVLALWLLSNAAVNVQVHLQEGILLRLHLESEVVDLVQIELEIPIQAHVLHARLQVQQFALEGLHLLLDLHLLDPIVEQGRDLAVQLFPLHDQICKEKEALEDDKKTIRNNTPSCIPLTGFSSLQVGTKSSRSLSSEPFSCDRMAWRQATLVRQVASSSACNINKQNMVMVTV